MTTFHTIEWKNNTVVLLDQRKLPNEETYVTCRTYPEVAEAIKNMTVRGAPAIGITGAMGLALAGLSLQTHSVDIFIEELIKISDFINQTRPTAVNLSWALEKMKRLAWHEHEKKTSVTDLQKILVAEAQKMHAEDIELNKRIGKHGSALISDGSSILTHCNTGHLATAGYGTALGVIYSARDEGKKIHVFADETRPFLQGSRLTAWELTKSKVPVTLICDNMAGFLMKQGKVDLVIVGADRIAANGDTANKIGTYSVAVLAKTHNVPFYVAAPLSTIDLHTKTGDDIVIEQRSHQEVTEIQKIKIAPENITVWNPAFDVTPSELITGIITEKGIVSGDYVKGLKQLF